MKKEEITKDEVKEFLRDLYRISKKHNIFIDGCGCCGSPFLIRLRKMPEGYKIDEGEGSWENLTPKF